METRSSAPPRIPPTRLPAARPLGAPGLPFSPLSPSEKLGQALAPTTLSFLSRRLDVFSCFGNGTVSPNIGGLQCGDKDPKLAQFHVYF